MKIKRNLHVLAVPDVAATSAFFTDVLGFQEIFRGPHWRFVELGKCRIMLGEAPDALQPQELGDHGYFAYWIVDDVQAFHDEWKEKGADIFLEMQDREWGMREFGVRTPDGHRLVVAQVIREPED